MRTRTFWVALVAVVFLTACASLSPGSPASARIRSVSGSAEIARDGGDWQPANVWKKLDADDRARTGANGKIDFSLGRYGGVLTLMPSSLIEFQQLGPAAPGDRIVAVINLLEGRVVGDTLKLPPNARIQVRTREAVHEIP